MQSRGTNITTALSKQRCSNVLLNYSPTSHDILSITLSFSLTLLGTIKCEMRFFILLYKKLM